MFFGRFWAQFLHDSLGWAQRCGMSFPYSLGRIGAHAGAYKRCQSDPAWCGCELTRKVQAKFGGPLCACSLITVSVNTKAYAWLELGWQTKPVTLPLSCSDYRSFFFFCRWQCTKLTWFWHLLTMVSHVAVFWRNRKVIKTMKDIFWVVLHWFCCFCDFHWNEIMQMPLTEQVLYPRRIPYHVQFGSAFVIEKIRKLYLQQ